MYIGLISLGCAKNQVDSEEILSFFKRNGHEIVSDLSLANMIIINSCGFLKEAKKEVYDVIDAVHEDFNVPIIVTGCLATRIGEQIKKDKPCVSLVVPIHDYPNFAYKMNEFLSCNDFTESMSNIKRIYSTENYQAYLKISDGCNNRCTYCTIPLIRGSFHSIPLKTLEMELEEIASNNVKELIIISQDTTRYGTDHPELNENICTLLKKVLEYKQFEFIKLLYLYPDEITDELIQLFKENPRLTPYFDVPIQHSSDKILKAMHRRGSRQYLLDLFKKIKEEVPNAILRTTIMCGFPGETEEDIDDLIDFMNQVKFDHLGVFTYSREKGTPSYSFDDQVPAKIKSERYDRIMKEQIRISYKKNYAHIGETMRAIITGYDDKMLAYMGTSYIFAPDDIDGYMYIYSDEALEKGDIIDVKVIDANIYDLICEKIH